MMTEEQYMDFHDRLFAAIDDVSECNADDCTCCLTDHARALLAVVWRHCPVRWARRTWVVHQPVGLLPDWACQTCRVEYPCEEITVVAEEMGIRA